MSDLSGYSDEQLTSMAAQAHLQSLPDDQLQALATPAAPAPKPPPVGTATDVAKSGGKGLIEGVGTVLGMPADAWHMLDRGYQNLLTRGAVAAGIMTPEQGEALRKPIGDAEEPAMGSASINKALLKGADALPGGDGTSAENYQPSTTPGKYAETIGSFVAPAATFGASKLSEVPGAVLKQAVLPGAASETAGEMTRGTALEPYARMAGAIAGGAPSIAASYLRSAGRPLSAALSTMNDGDFTAAQNLVDESRAAGAPLTLPEAIQHVTNGATSLGDVARVVENSRAGAPVMKQFYADRPAQTNQLARGAFDQVSPAAAEPTEVAPRVQEAALGPPQGAPPDTIRGAEQARSAQTGPFYQAAETETVPAEHVEGILQQLDDAIASDKTGILAKPLGQVRDLLTDQPASAGTAPQRVPRQTPSGGTIYETVPGEPATPRVPITDIGNLDRARKFLRDQLSLPAFAADAIPKETASNVSGILSNLRGVMEDASDNFAQGRALHAQITNDTVNPLIRSATGQVADAPTFDQQAQILFNRNPLPGSEGQVGKAVGTIASQDPEAAAQLVRLYTERTFNEAQRAGTPAQAQFAGPRYARLLAGNPQQAANLEAAVRALPDGDTRWGAFQNSLKIMQAQGWRAPAGSMTEFNRQIAEELGAGSGLQDAASTATSPGKWGSWIADRAQQYSYRKNTEQLARLFTEGNISDLRNLAASAPGTRRAAAALATAMAPTLSRLTGPDGGQQQPNRSP